jgi:metallo-beta-lactamase class B
MKKLGLDPTQIKAVLIAHGHSDHYGGALYLQEHYGAHVYMSAQDWDFIYPAPSGQKPHAGQPGPLPKRDMILAEGQPFSLGGETITPVLIPGHTPGAMGFIFPVKDEGHTHIAALFGGTILSPARRFKPDQWEQYLKSLNHFKEITQKMNADVELVNHPIMDGAFDKMARLKERKPGQPNPFVVGTAGFQKFLDVMTECARAQLDRVGGSV